MSEAENKLPIPMQLLQLATSKMVSKPIYVAAKLGLADLLSQGPLAVEELARLTETHAESLYRLMRALASIGIFREGEQRNFSLTPLAEVFQDKPGSVRGMVLWFGDPAHDQAWEYLLYSVQTGKPAFDKAHGMPAFEYMKQNPELAEIFNRAMSANAKNIHSAIADAYDFSSVKTLYDIGGGHGHLVRLVLEKHPHLKAGVADLEHVVRGTRKSLADLSDRCVFHAVDFFKKLPQGADAHILSFVLHDWSDSECQEILTNCHDALPNEGKLFIGENVIEPGNEPAFGKLIDMEMLVMTTGRERTREDFVRILSASGFQLKKVHPTKSPVSLLESEKR